MSKSKYPQQLDTSIEIPIVRDNIIEVGSDVINSLRSAIFQIEKTLGINPQGAVGNTLSERLNRSIDSNGNIKSNALALSNILTGPILNSDVSRVAGIEESKLKLNYSTTLLQDEISIVNRSLENIISQVEEISSTLSSHINSSAVNRHPATAISVVVNDEESDTATLSLDAGSVQSALGKIYSSHINYTGDAISADNNSHISSQIFFDNSDVLTILDSNNVQDAIEELATSSLDTDVLHQDLFHSNGILKIGEITTANDATSGLVLANDVAVSFLKSSSTDSGISVVNIDESLVLDGFTLSKSDMLTISDVTDTLNLYSGSYQIESFQLDGDGNVYTISIFGILSGDSTSSTLAKISKNTNIETNSAALLTSVRQEASLTSSVSVQVCNPDAVNIISVNILPHEITISNRFINLSIDGNTSFEIDVYNSSAERQTIDSIIVKINEQAAEDKLNILAYRLNLNNKTELVIAHNIPDELDELHTLKISRGSDDAIDSLGFADIEDLTINCKFGTSYYINGVKYSGLKTKLDTTEISFISGDIIINGTGVDVDFTTLNIKRGDLVIISDSADDDGSYVVSSVTENQVLVSSEQLPSGFVSNSESDFTRIRIFENIVSLENLLFTEISGSFGSMLIDIFMDSDRNLFYNRRFEYLAQISSSTSLVSIIDFDGDISDNEFGLTIAGGSDYVTLTLDDGESKNIRGSNIYTWIRSGTSAVKLKLYIPSVDDLNTKITSDGASILMTLFGLSDVNSDDNLLLSRSSFDNFSGRFSGGIGSPKVIEKIRHGNIGISELGTDIKNIYVDLPISDLRNSGIIYGLEVSDQDLTDDGLYTFTVQRGLAYVNGKRIEINESQTIITDLDSADTDKIFIVINEDGAIAFASAVSTCYNPFNETETAVLATLEFDTVNVAAVDLRLFISDIDLKILNSITVSPQRGMGHFSDLGEALKYAKRFYHLYPNAGVPTVHLKSGVFEKVIEFDESDRTATNWYNTIASSEENKVPTDEIDKYIDNGLFLDFPVNITGEGTSTIVSVISRYTFSDSTVDYRGFIAIAGDGFTSHNSVLDSLTSGSVYISNLKFKDTRSDLIDLNLTDGTDDLLFTVEFDKVTFEYSSGFGNRRDNALNDFAIRIQEYDDETTNKGNLIVNGCKFINSYIGVLEPERLKNLLIINNFLMGDSELSLLSKNLLQFSISNSGSNITILGNHNTSNFTNVDETGDPVFATEDSTSWGDRVSKHLYVGGKVSAEGNGDFGGNLTVAGEISGASYAYATPLTREKQVFFDTLSDPGMGSTLATVSDFGNRFVNGRYWKTLEFPNDLTAFSMIRLDIQPGETLTDLILFYSSIDSGSSIFGDYSIAVYYDDYYGNSTVELSPTESNTITSDGEMASATYNGLNIAGAIGKYVYILIWRLTATGYAEDIHYVWYKTEVESVEGIGGLI